MIQKMITESIGPLRNSSGNNYEPEDDLEIPSIGEYIAKDVASYNDRYLHKISHIRLDDSDVVIYSEEVNIVPVKTGISGICSVTKELCRIPKREFKDLIKELMSEDE